MTLIEKINSRKRWRFAVGIGAHTTITVIACHYEEAIFRARLAIEARYRRQKKEDLIPVAWDLYLYEVKPYGKESSQDHPHSKASEDSPPIEVQIATVWHEGSKTFYRARLLNKMTNEDVQGESESK